MIIPKVSSRNFLTTEYIRFILEIVVEKNGPNENKLMVFDNYPDRVNY